MPCREMTKLTANIVNTQKNNTSLMMKMTLMPQYNNNKQSPW